MNKWWPNILRPNCSEFWNHEWIKHGTCAASLSCLDSQHKYFSKGLELYSRVELNSVLEKYGIQPSQTYQVKQIRDAILNSYGIMPKIQCLPPQQTEDAQILGQIELCFTKAFQMENCTHSAERWSGPAPKSDSSYRPLHVCDDDLDVFDDGPGLPPPVSE
ncbi:ribonuclease T2 activity, partial [Pristimantis euphronides]